MARTTVAFGLALAALGMISYVASGMASATALIPALFGLPLALLGWLATAERRRKTAMHVAAGLGLLGFLAPLGRLIPSLASFELTIASASLIAMALLCGTFVALCVRSFVMAPRPAAAT